MKHITKFQFQTTFLLLDQFQTAQTRQQCMFFRHFHINTAHQAKSKISWDTPITVSKPFSILNAFRSSSKLTIITWVVKINALLSWRCYQFSWHFILVFGSIVFHAGGSGNTRRYIFDILTPGMDSIASLCAWTLPSFWHSAIWLVCQTFHHGQDLFSWWLVRSWNVLHTLWTTFEITWEQNRESNTDTKLTW